jgi:hypothetical protein
MSLTYSVSLENYAVTFASLATVKWFRSYLSDRTQIRICLSLSPLRITHGVPQGAILDRLSEPSSHLLFCIYINNLPQSSLTSLLESYVDDSSSSSHFMIHDVDSAAIPVVCCRHLNLHK